MRRFLLALAILLGGLAVAVAPAGIASATPVQIPDIGTFSGTGVFDLSTPSCSSAPFHTVFEGTYTNNEGSGSFRLDGCAALPISGTAAPYSGTAWLTKPNGTVSVGTFSGTIDIITGSFNLTLSLPSTLAPPPSVRLVGTWTSSGVPGVPGPISGAIITGLQVTLRPPPPPVAA